MGRSPKAIRSIRKPDEPKLRYEAFKLFVEVAELGSLSKVAALRQTTQPHISRQITRLERECGGTLFRCTGKGVILSELGERIIPKVCSWLTETQRLENDIKTASGEAIGVVRIGILPSAVPPLAGAVYSRLKAEFPLVKLVVREGHGGQLESWLADGSVDLALLYRHNPKPGDGEKYLIKASTYLIGSIGDRLTSNPTVPFSALHNLPLVQYCRPYSWRDYLDEISRSNGVVLNTILEAESVRFQMEVVSQGAGYALVGPYAFRQQARTGRLQASKVISPALDRHIALCLSKHGPITPACRIVMQIIEDVLTGSQDLIEEI